MKHGKNNMSCHSYITKDMMPLAESGTLKSGFGFTTKVLNETECNSLYDDIQYDRVSFYLRYLEMFGVADSRHKMCQDDELKM